MRRASVTAAAPSRKQNTEDTLFERVEGQVQASVEWLRLMVEALGALVIGAGIVLVIVALLRHLLVDRGGSFVPIRLRFARYLTLALELQLAADILSTSVAPTWDRIGKLAAIAVIRTALNYFLSKELQAESAGEERSRAGGSGEAGKGA
jgi:uncharacterized membrane protein